MHSLNDQHLLCEYVERRSEAAFAELVHRHVDFVYCTALRIVRDSHLAEDVTQAVFTALAGSAGQIAGRPVLSGWLHRTAQNLAANAVRSDVRRRVREQEAAAMNELLSGSETTWEHIAPHLDDALCELNEADRDALFLRFFERKSAREMAHILGTSEDAAQKRVFRAVERLRDFFGKRGVSASASGLVAVISANAIQAAPVGLAATITTAAIAGTTLTATATSTAIKAIIMTTTQKTLIALALIAAVATPLVLQHREIARLRKDVAALRSEEKPAMANRQREGLAPSQAAVMAAAPKVEASAPSYLPPAEAVAKIAALLSERKPMDKTRMEAWAKLVALIAPGQMDQALLAAQQLADQEIRDAVVQTLFRNWTNPRAALAFATDNFQGKEESDAICDALQRWAAQDPEGAFAAWREQAADSTKRLRWGGGQQEIVKALFEGAAQKDFQKAVDGLKGLDWDLFGSALKGMGATAAKTDQGRELFLKQLKGVSDLPVSYEAMTSFMFNWSQCDLPSAMSWVENQPAGKPRDYALRQVGLNYIRRDPKTGADWWLAQAAPAERSQALFGIAQTWACTDIKAAGEWLNRQGAGEEVDSGRSAFADVAVDHDPVTALKWAESITQPPFRNEVMVRTWQKWRRSDAAGADQFLAQCGWPAELVAQARGGAASN
jgi:RNA polymerase sigma factor (sigma-70 family)